MLLLLSTATVLVCAVSPASLPDSPDSVPDSRPLLQKRSDDPNPLEAVVQQLSAETAQLKAQLSAETTQLKAQLSAETTQLKARLDTLERRVAFRVQFSVDQTPPSSAPFKFDSVIFNDGNAYDTITGTFNAPYAGVYLFSLQIFTKIAEWPLIDIMVNGQIKARMAVDSTTGSPAQSDVTSLLVQLAPGDRVWVQQATTNIQILGGVHTFFTGALQYTS